MWKLPTYKKLQKRLLPSQETTPFLNTASLPVKAKQQKLFQPARRPPSIFTVFASSFFAGYPSSLRRFYVFPRNQAKQKLYCIQYRTQQDTRRGIYIDIS